MVEEGVARIVTCRIDRRGFLHRREYEKEMIYSAYRFKMTQTFELDLEAVASRVYLQQLWSLFLWKSFIDLMPYTTLHALNPSQTLSFPNSRHSLPVRETKVQLHST